MRRIGFVGTGSMGTPMIRRLLQAGHSVRVFVRRPEAFDALLETLRAEGVGARPERAATAADCARDADFVCTNVTTTQDVEALLFGADGIAAGAPAGCTVLDFSTISAVATRDFAARLARQGIIFMDCPVSGGAKGAQAGTLAIMVGGTEESVEHARPVLRVLGASITRCGDTGAGQVVKACNQMVMVVNIQGIAEAMLFARANGVDPAVALPALQAGFAGSKMLDLMGPKMAERDFSAAIEARLHQKDFGLIVEITQRLGLSLPVTALVSQQLNALVGRGWGRDDTSSLLRVLEGANPRPASDED